MDSVPCVRASSSGRGRSARFTKTKPAYSSTRDRVQRVRGPVEPLVLPHVRRADQAPVQVVGPRVVRTLNALRRLPRSSSSRNFVPRWSTRCRSRSRGPRRCGRRTSTRPQRPERRSRRDSPPPRDRPNATQSPHQIRSRSSSQTSKLGDRAGQRGAWTPVVLGGLEPEIGGGLHRQIRAPSPDGGLNGRSTPAGQSIRRTAKKGKAAGGSAQEPGGGGVSPIERPGERHLRTTLCPWSGSPSSATSS